MGMPPASTSRSRKETVKRPGLALPTTSSASASALARAESARSSAARGWARRRLKVTARGYSLSVPDFPGSKQKNATIGPFCPVVVAPAGSVCDCGGRSRGPASVQSATRSATEDLARRLEVKARDYSLCVPDLSDLALAAEIGRPRNSMRSFGAWPFAACLYRLPARKELRSTQSACPTRRLPAARHRHLCSGTFPGRSPPYVFSSPAPSHKNF